MYDVCNCSLGWVMSNRFIVAENGNPGIFTDICGVGESRTYSFDFSPWVEDNAALTGVVWSVEAGGVTVGVPVLTGSVSSVLLSAPSSGNSLLKVTGSSVSAVRVVYLVVRVVEPIVAVGGDYWV